jgi:hypothetical protein
MRAGNARDAVMCGPPERHSAPRQHRPTHTNTETMSTVLARVTVTASAAKAPVANKTTTKTVAPQQRASIGARAVAFAKTNVPAAVALVNAVAASPAHAEAGKLFDFDLTLPIIATEFLLLMTILDKTVFGPVGKALDDRDELIRSQLAAVGDNSSEVESLIVSIRLREFIFVSFFRIAGVVVSAPTTRDAGVDPRVPRARSHGCAMRLGFGLSARGFGFSILFFLVDCLPIRMGISKKSIANGSTDDCGVSTTRPHPHLTGSKGEDYRRCPR